LFDTVEGNIRFRARKHDFVNGRCKWCGASAAQFDRDDGLESHAYEFIHTDKPEEIFNMKFDVIVGNPPYQLADGGAQASATPIYHLFVEQAKKMSSRYIVMIIPSRWFAGGKGLDEFRFSMIDDMRIRVLHDFLNSSDCFGHGVEIKSGVCYFKWCRDMKGKCEFVTHLPDGSISKDIRYLKYNNSDVVIRRNEAISILEKVGVSQNSFARLVSARKPFGLSTTDVGHELKKSGDVLLYKRGGRAFISKNNIIKNIDWLNKYKIYITKAYGASDEWPHQIINKPIIGEVGSCCSETYLVIGPFANKEICSNVVSYMETRLFRFMVSLRKISQDATQSVYQFVPMQDFSKPWTDEELYMKYNLTKDEIAFIESMIKPME
jgi:site-specific DNA-methyltransferase (adenine-specific)